MNALPQNLGSRTVLLIDDDPCMHPLVTGILKPLGLNVISALDAREGIEIARAQPVQLLLLDNNLAQDETGLEVLRQLKRDEQLRAIPVIMVTGQEGDTILAHCFAAGAVDYIRKPFGPVELRARVSSVLERQRMLGELTNAAKFDRLTGLANRATLTEELSASLERSHRDESYRFALMFLDFDRFKFVNDTMGHDVGDMLLQAIAGRLLHNVRVSGELDHGRASTTVARLGGDEFVVLLSGIKTIDEAEQVGARLLRALDKPYSISGHTVQSTASIGTVMSAAHYTNPVEVLRDADQAMYEAKARGKACQVVFSVTMRDAANRAVELERALCNAIELQELRVHFQPIFSLETGRTIAFESLARWTHPIFGDVEPSTFIPVAEQVGVIGALSEQIIHAACRTFSELLTIDASLEFVSVNLSYMQISDDDLVSRLLGITNAYHLHPKNLQVELSESVMVRHRGKVTRFIKQLRDAGIRVAMDNFGARESSLSCLQDFSVVSLKLDRSIIANSVQAREFAALLHAVITLAENLGFAVVAEGVETRDQLVLLQALGCGFAQGFLMAMPMNAEDVREFVQHGSTWLSPSLEAA